MNKINNLILLISISLSPIALNGSLILTNFIISGSIITFNLTGTLSGPLAPGLNRNILTIQNPTAAATWINPNTNSSGNISIPTDSGVINTTIPKSLISGTVFDNNKPPGDFINLVFDAGLTLDDNTNGGSISFDISPFGIDSNVVESSQLYLSWGKQSSADFCPTIWNRTK